MSRRLLLVTSVILFSTPPSGAQEPKKEHFGHPQAFWLERLGSKSQLERDEAVLVFAKVGTDGREAAPLLKPLLKDADPGVRLRVAVALWKVQDDGKDSTATLAADFPRLSPAHKAEVVSFVFGLKKVDASVFAMFEAFVKDPQLVAQVHYHLSALGDEAIPLYGKWIERSTGKERVTVLAATPVPYVLASNGEVVAPYLKDADPRCRAAANSALLLVADKRDAAVDALVELAGSKDAEAADWAVRSLCNLRPASGKGAAVYHRALKHAKLEYRLAAAAAVLAVAPDRAADVVPVLEEGVKDPDALMRQRAYWLAAGVKDGGDTLVPALLAKLKAPSTGEEYMVLGALAPHAARVGKEVGEALFADPKVAPRYFTPALRPFVPHFTGLIVKYLGGDDAARKSAAVGAAQWASGEAAGALLPHLTPLLKDDAVVDRVLQTLAAQGSDARAAAPEVFALLERKPTPARVAAVQRTLAAVRPEPKALAGMLDTFKDKPDLTPEVRVLAAELARLHPERRKEAAAHLAPLLATKQTARSPGVLRLLESLGPDAAELVPALHARLKEDPSMIIFLDRALVRIGRPAGEVAPVLLAHADKIENGSELLRIARVLAAVAPDKRLALEEKINKLLVERLEKSPTGSEADYNLSLLVTLCDEPAGPTKALLPLLKKVVRDHRGGSAVPLLRADVAAAIARLDPDAAAETVRVLEGQLGTYPRCSLDVMTGLLRLNPDHPRALAELKKYFAEPFQPYAFAVSVAVQCDKPLPGVREALQTALKSPQNNYVKFRAYLVLMRYEGRLNPAWVDELFRAAEQDPGVLRELPTLGPLARPLLPRLQALPADEYRANVLADIVMKIERSR